MFLPKPHIHNAQQNKHCKLLLPNLKLLFRVLSWNSVQSATMTLLAISSERANLTLSCFFMMEASYKLHKLFQTTDIPAFICTGCAARTTCIFPTPCPFSAARHVSCFTSPSPNFLTGPVVLRRA